MRLQDSNFTDPAGLLNYANLEDPNFWAPFDFSNVVRL